MHERFEWPEPSPEALEISLRVANHIRHRLHAAGGWLDFSEFMELALYSPGIGYYSAGSAKLGPAGDFVTAPEISPLFARCLTRACLPWLQTHNGGGILELGAGTGAMAAEVLRSLARHGYPDVRYSILEVSGELRERQRETLARLAPAHCGNVTWLERLPDAPLSGIVLANEVADALPFSRFVVRDGVLRAYGVVESAGKFHWAPGEPSPALAAAVAGIERGLGRRFAEGYCSEVCLRLPGWVGAVAGVLGSGLILLADYGMSRREYYLPERRDGTLTCHYRHRAHADPFFHPGLQDITAWVDFTAVAEAAETAGLRVAGYSTLAHFLIDSGLDAEFANADLAAVGQAKRLLLPGEMGERIRLMALARGDAEPAGFAFRDLRHQL